MLLLILFGVGFLVVLGAGSILRSRHAFLILAVVGIGIWTMYAIYIALFANCPAQGECDNGLGVIFLGATLVGWLTGIAALWMVCRLRRP